MYVELEKIENIKLQTTLAAGVSGVAVSMVAFQAIDPGSTPGSRSLLFLIDAGSIG